MPLIKCRECGREVSTEAAACPGCGAPIKPQKIQAPQTIVAKKQISTLKGCLIIVLVFIAIPVVIGIMNSGGHDSSSATPQTVATVAPPPQATPSQAPSLTPFRERKIRHVLTAAEEEKPETGEERRYAKGEKEEVRLAAPVEKRMKWSLSGDPKIAGREDGAAFWDAIKDDKKLREGRINFMNSVVRFDTISAEYRWLVSGSVGALEVVERDGGESFPIEGAKIGVTYEDVYANAFASAEKEAREKWISENLGIKPSSQPSEAVMKSRREIFKKWAVENTAVTDIAFDDAGITMFVTLTPEKYTNRDNVRLIAESLARAYVNQTGAEFVGCSVFLGNQEYAKGYSR